MVQSDISDTNNRWVEFPITFPNAVYCAVSCNSTTRDYAGTQWQVAGSMYATTLRVLNSGMGLYRQGEFICIGS